MLLLIMVVVVPDLEADLSRGLGASTLEDETPLHFHSSPRLAAGHEDRHSSIGPEIGHMKLQDHTRVLRLRSGELLELLGQHSSAHQAAVAGPAERVHLVVPNMLIKFGVRHLDLDNSYRLPFCSHI